MNIKRLSVAFLGTAALAFVVTAGTTYLYSWMAHGIGQVDLGTAIRAGMILGIVLTLVGEKKPG